MADEPPFLIEPLGSHHDRAAFACESDDLTNYMQKIAKQHDKNGMSAIYVMSGADKTRILGYYTISMHMIRAGEIDANILRALKLPQGGDLPAALIGRLARDHAHKGQKIGPMLVADALARISRASHEVGCAAAIVDPENERATTFWEKFGFQPFAEHKRLFLPITTIRKLL